MRWFLHLWSLAISLVACEGENSTIDWTERLRLDDKYLNPSGNSRCPSKCRYYFAGASPRDAVICQKQASGVGTAQQNAEFGVACFPAYGCGRDMITCVDQTWTSELPNISDVQMACSNLNDLVSENPWTCGSEAEGRPACQHDTPNNNVGKWLLASAELGCGWGSTYGNVAPDYQGVSLPYSSFFTVSSEYECCLKAMSFENSTWAEGGGWCCTFLSTERYGMQSGSREDHLCQYGFLFWQAWSSLRVLHMFMHATTCSFTEKGLVLKWISMVDLCHIHLPCCSVCQCTL